VDIVIAAEELRYAAQAIGRVKGDIVLGSNLDMPLNAYYL